MNNPWSVPTKSLTVDHKFRFAFSEEFQKRDVGRMEGDIESFKPGEVQSLLDDFLRNQSQNPRLHPSIFKYFGNLIEQFPRLYMEIREAHLANAEAISTLKAKCDPHQVCGFLKMDASRFNLNFGSAAPLKRNAESCTKSFQELLDDFSKKAQAVLLEARIKASEELFAELNPEKFQAKAAELWVEECRCLGSDVNTLDQRYSITEEVVSDSDDEGVSDSPSENIDGGVGRPVHIKIPLSAFLYRVAGEKITSIINSKIDERRSAWARRANTDRAKNVQLQAAVIRASDAAPEDADRSILQEVSSMLQVGFQEQRTQILEELHKMLECKQPSGGESKNYGGKRKNEVGAAGLTHGGPTIMESRMPKKKKWPHPPNASDDLQARKGCEKSKSPHQYHHHNQPKPPSEARTPNSVIVDGVAYVRKGEAPSKTDGNELQALNCRTGGKSGVPHRGKGRGRGRGRGRVIAASEY